MRQGVRTHKTCLQRDATSPAPSPRRVTKQVKRPARRFDHHQSFLHATGTDLHDVAIKPSRRAKSGSALVSVEMGSPRPSPRRWLRSKVASAAAESDIDLDPLSGKEDTLILWHITLTIALISFRKNPRNGGHREQPPTRQAKIHHPQEARFPGDPETRDRPSQAPPKL